MHSSVSVSSQSQGETVLARIRTKQRQISELTPFSNTSLRVGTAPWRVGTERVMHLLLPYAQHVARIYRLTQERWGCQCMENHFACVWLKHPAPRASSFDFFVMPNKDPAARRAWVPQGLDISWDGNRKRKRAESIPVRHTKGKCMTRDRYSWPAVSDGKPH